MGQYMNFWCGRTAVAVAVIIAATCCSAQAVEPTAKAVPEKELQPKIAYCKTCHGQSGQGYRGATPIPRLAGQQVEYFENQTKAFVERRRENKFMYNVAHVLSPAMLTALAKHFSTLNPKPLGGASRDHISEGKTIYDEGLPKSDVPACAACHGADAKGNGLFPRLAGQLNEYIVKNLTNWDKERGQDRKNPDNSAIMQPIAHNLTPAQIAAVAAYLNYLE